MSSARCDRCGAEKRAAWKLGFDLGVKAYRVADAELGNEAFSLSTDIIIDLCSESCLHEAEAAVRAGKDPRKERAE